MITESDNFVEKYRSATQMQHQGQKLQKLPENKPWKP